MKRGFRSKHGYSTNSGIFAKRGDPWVSRRQGERDFGRNIESENPDFDQFFATKAQPKPKYVDPKPKKVEKTEKQKIVEQMRKDIWAAKLRERNRTVKG